MIEGTNSNTTIFEDFLDIIPAVDCGASFDVIHDLERRRDNVLNGGINCIPLPLPRFREDWPGLEHEQYIVITASSKIGKTQITSNLCLYSVLEYAFEHPHQCSVDFLYFNLEESRERIYQRYMSHLLYKFDQWRLSPRDLRSTSVEYPLPEEALELLKSEKYQQRLKFFDDHVHFNNVDTNPTGILRVCEEWARKVGKYTSRTVLSRDGSGRKVEEFVDYQLNDPNHYTIVLVDHVRNIDLERGYTQKQNIDKFSEYALKYMRDRYKQCVIAIQQQATETEGLEAIKQKRMTPSVAGLADSKYTTQDANMVVSYFDPNLFGLPNWCGYKINDVDGTGLKDYARFMTVLRGRDGEVGGTCPLFFDGAVCHVEELPPPDNVAELTKYYTRVQNMKSYRQQKKFSSLALFNFIKNLFL